MLDVMQLLSDLEAQAPNASSYYVRTLEPYEKLPEGIGYPDAPQKEWVWVAFSKLDHSPLATLITAPCQGLVFILRVHAYKSYRSTVLVGLLRKALADMKARGYAKYAVALSVNRKEERQLGSIIKRAGGTEEPETFTLFHGPTDIKY